MREVGWKKSAGCSREATDASWKAEEDDDRSHGEQDGAEESEDEGEGEGKYDEREVDARCVMVRMAGRGSMCPGRKISKRAAGNDDRKDCCRVLCIGICVNPCMHSRLGDSVHALRNKVSVNVAKQMYPAERENRKNVPCRI